MTHGRGPHVHPGQAQGHDSDGALVMLCDALVLIATVCGFPLNWRQLSLSFASFSQSICRPGRTDSYSRR